MRAMDSTTTTTRWRAPERRSCAAAFTLTEVIIGSTISVFVLAGVLTVFLFLGRSGANVGNYAEMEKEARRGLELFAEDTRQASELVWVSPTEVRITVNLGSITYGYNASSREFYRQLGSGARVRLIGGIEAFSFAGYMITGAAVDLSDLSTEAKRTAASRVTKQLQISLRAVRTTQTVSTATNTVLSARFILRNKRVTT